MSIFSFIGNLFKPAADLIDNIHTSTEEKGEIQIKLGKVKVELKKIEAQTQEEMLKYQTKIAELQMKLSEEAAKVAIAESKSDSAFTRMYRPAILTGMFILICLNSFGLLVHNVPDIFLSVFGAAFGVVGMGRTAEKIIRIKK